MLKSKFSWSIENPQSSAQRDIPRVPWVHAATVQEQRAESSGWTLFGITLKDQKSFYSLLKSKVSSLSSLLSIEPIGFVQFAKCIYPVTSTQSFANCTNCIFIVQPCPICDLQTMTGWRHPRTVAALRIHEVLGPGQDKYQDIRHPCWCVASGLASGLSWNLGRNSDTIASTHISTPQQSFEILWAFLPLISFNRLLAASIMAE